MSELEQETQDLKAIINFKLSESELNKEVLTEAQQYREELRSVIQKLEGEKEKECSLLQTKIQVCMIFFSDRFCHYLLLRWY